MVLMVLMAILFSYILLNKIISKWVKHSGIVLMDFYFSVILLYKKNR
jgi:hypothetical protein